MKRESAVHFETNSRIHMGLAVRDLAKSVAFYSTLFGQAPTKIRPGYAKFEVADPPVNLALNEVPGPTGPNNSVAHFGIQWKSTASVGLAATRLQAAGLETVIEENVTCCYAIQNKVWATDPDGNQWEVYVVLDDDAPQRQSAPRACCADQPECCDDKTACCVPAAGASGCVCSA
jgi:catechol 2,3-dioxygenase-like lactoylglutathione lyase family enzyme